jgi:hypothetical protein
MMNELYKRNPKDYALMLIQEGLVDAEAMVLALLGTMTPDDVLYALDANELSPRFNMDEDEDYDDSMDGDETSALASAGWGTDEDY